MPSRANLNLLEVLLADAAERAAAHARLRTGQPGRQWGLDAINRAVVVRCVSAWESLPGRAERTPGRIKAARFGVQQALVALGAITLVP
jgi:hypothetical protein